VAALVFGLAFPGPAMGATLTVLEAPCSCGPVISGDGAEPGCGDTAHLDERRHCSCSVGTCGLCTTRDGLTSRQRSTVQSFSTDAGLTSRVYAGFLAHPPRAPSRAAPPSVEPTPSEPPLYLDLQVLLI